MKAENKTKRCCYCGSTEHVTEKTDKKLKCKIEMMPDLQFYSLDFIKELDKVINLDAILDLSKKEADNVKRT